MLFSALTSPPIPLFLTYGTMEHRSRTSSEALAPSGLMIPHKPTLYVEVQCKGLREAGIIRTDLVPASAGLRFEAERF